MNLVVAPLFARVKFFICTTHVDRDGFGPKEVSVDVILTAFEFRSCPKTFIAPLKPGSVTRVQIRTLEKL